LKFEKLEFEIPSCSFVASLISSKILFSQQDFPWVEGKALAEPLRGDPPYPPFPASSPVRLEAGVELLAAIDEECRAADVVGIVAGDLHRGAAEVFRLADSACTAPAA
jgi:hypothetical protein